MPTRRERQLEQENETLRRRLGLKPRDRRRLELELLLRWRRRGKPALRDKLWRCAMWEAAAEEAERDGCTLTARRLAERARDIARGKE